MIILTSGETALLYMLFTTIAILYSTYIPAQSKTALLVIDVQNCFLPGGTLPVTDGDDVIPIINNIRRKYAQQIDMTVFSQDWHCDNHVSFASEHDGHNNYDVIPLSYTSTGKLCTSNDNQCPITVNQTLWPDHCIINSTDAKFSSQLKIEDEDIVVRKGYNCQVDSYSAFYDNGGFSKTELENILGRHDISTVIVTGLALDFCVYYTSKDAKKIGYEVYTVLDASRPVNSNNVPSILNDLKSRGVHVINSIDLDKVIASSTACVFDPVIHQTLLLCSLFVLYFMY